MRRLPPLNPLRVFEAAARFESFNRAAEALHLTPSAISHQVKALERYLGVALFRRSVRQVTLTDTGRQYLPPVRDALEQIGTATEQVLRPQPSPMLTVSTAPAFAAGWLVPRLMGFNLAHPEIDLRLDASIQLVDFDTSDVDAAVRSTTETRFPGLHAHRLFGEALIPVCSPDYAEAVGLERPSDLARATLLHVDARRDMWRQWLAAAGVDGIDPDAGQKFAHDAISVEAAAAGGGVAMGVRRVVAGQLREGRLIAPFELTVTTDYAYYLLYPPPAEADSKIGAFRDWLLTTIAEETRPDAGGD